MTDKLNYSCISYLLLCFWKFLLLFYLGFAFLRCCCALSLEGRRSSQLSYLALFFLFNILFHLFISSWWWFRYYFGHFWLFSFKDPWFCFGIVLTLWLFIGKDHLGCLFLLACELTLHEVQNTTPFLLLLLRCNFRLSFDFLFLLYWLGLLFCLFCCVFDVLCDATNVFECK